MRVFGPISTRGARGIDQTSFVTPTAWRQLKLNLYGGAGHPVATFNLSSVQNKITI